MESLRSSAIPTLDHDDLAERMLSPSRPTRCANLLCCSVIQSLLCAIINSGLLIIAAMGDIAGLLSTWKDLNVDPKTCCIFLHVFALWVRLIIDKMLLRTYTNEVEVVGHKL